MKILLLIFIAILVAYFENKGKIDRWTVFIVRWALTLSAPLWLGGLFSIFGVVMLFQTIYSPTRNYLEGRDIWFVDETSFVGKLFKKYFPTFGIRALFLAEFVIAILLIIS